jgi:hypothetical protein
MHSPGRFEPILALTRKLAKRVSSNDPVLDALLARLHGRSAAQSKETGGLE